LLVLGEAVQPQEQRVTQPRVEARRQVYVQVAPLVQGRRPYAAVLAVVGGVVDDLAAQLLVDVHEVRGLVAPADGAGDVPRNEHQDEDAEPAQGGHGAVSPFLGADTRSGGPVLSSATRRTPVQGRSGPGRGRRPGIGGPAGGSFRVDCAGEMTETGCVHWVMLALWLDPAGGNGSG